MTTLIEAAAKKLMTAIALDRHDVGDWPDDSRKAYEALEQAIAQEQPVRRCKTCKSFTLSNSAVCRSCNEDYCNWEPKP